MKNFCRKSIDPPEELVWSASGLHACFSAEDASLVIQTGERELEAIALPDNRAAKILMEVLKEKMPGTPSVCPPKTEEAFAG